ncbi:cell division cycle protein 20 homolog isoform X2 [Lingula anatina]|uniref:Cell division cycle protein 20 homolog isoform X2 n=1 Tax=Lingula anatina TaxID=7574 RepID=A0A1S3H1A9_LINAN|nr:cell division cycle protein 20 homolog isoform X2 [Lingula anatina]|eukprot:XP_013379266.1 cell division cycle protein 20 homolog isoform X2 [Lingula anatina]
MPKRGDFKVEKLSEIAKRRNQIKQRKSDIMAHFNFENNLSELTKLDAPMQRGPLMRWQRKALSLDDQAGAGGSSDRHLSLPEGIAGGLSPRRTRIGSSRTPSKGSKTPLTCRTPNRTPGKTPGNSKKVSGKTPNKKTPLTPHSDRFIPSRSTTDQDLGHYLMMNNENENPLAGGKVDYQQRVTENICKGQQDPQNAKILSFRQKAPQAKEGYLNNLKVLYSSGKCSAPKALSTRQIPQQPDRILDAPELLDDYYLNLLDWSSHNHLALALGGSVYLWNAGNSTVTLLCELESEEEYISCVSWIKEGNILAVGNSTGAVQLWDVSQQKLMRTMGGHAARVGSLAWNSYILSSGCRSGAIHHHDVRVADHQVGTLTSHAQEVCGLQWAPDGRYLASGGNDNLLNVWEGMAEAPVHSFTHHMAAVKAVAWCPWQPSVLASGGGTADRHIRLWNVLTGACLHSVDTNSQVCSILWSSSYKELISGHGFSQNQLIIWKYPAMGRVAELTGHTARVLGLAMSPDGSTVASAAADETIRLWRCFEIDKQRKSSSSKSFKEPVTKSALQRGIR